MRHVTHSFVQGSAEWHEHRRRHFNASELAAAMGIDPDMPRNELLRLYATGDTKEFSEWVQAHILDKGHEYEAAARPLAEEEIGEDLYPVTVSADVDGLPLSASCDGATMLEDDSWEHKRRNAALVEAARRGEVLPHKRPQLEQTMFILGTTSCLFTVSDGTRDSAIHVRYVSDPALRAKIIPTWRQFKDDVANYKHVEYIPAGAEAQPQLPTVAVQVEGSIIIRDNLTAFGDALTAYVERINRKPETDDDFATLEATVKTLKAAEDALTTAENNALAQTESVDALRRTVARYKEIACSTRLLVDKIVRAEKENRAAAIIGEGRLELDARIRKINEQFGQDLMPAIAVDFAGVCRGLKTIKSRRDAVASELARATVEAHQIETVIAKNLELLAKDGYSQHIGLFADLKAIVAKPVEDFSAIVHQRIAAHNERIERERRAKEVVAAQPAAREVAPARPALVSAPPVTDTRPNDDRLLWTALEAICHEYGVTNDVALTWIGSTDWRGAVQRAMTPEAA